MLQAVIKSIRSGAVGELLDFVSPSFFDVVPVFESAACIKKLAGGLLGRGRPLAFDAVQTSLVARGLPVSVIGGSPINAPGDQKSGSNYASVDAGQCLLKIYFHQLLVCPEAILDMRFASFHFHTDKIDWTPMRVVHQWRPDFISPLREVYRGFYLNDTGAFKKGLKELGLESAEELFLRHFGEGDQSAVVFSGQHFRKSFHDIFVHCKEHKIKLHGDFLPFGILLGTLYENLSRLGGHHNVRKAFESSTTK